MNALASLALIAGLVTTAADGPVTATVTVEPDAPRLGDPITLTLRVEAEPGVKVVMPPFGDALGRFAIRDFAPGAATENGKQVHVQRYTLDVPMSGRQRIPPLRIEYGDGKELLTEEVALAIAPIVPGDDDRLREPRGVLDASPGARRVAIAWVAAGVVALAALAWLFRAGKRRAEQEVRRSAYEVAAERLAELERRGAPSPEEADGWYVDLSDVVRRYVEDRFGVRAPELTTEEFLREAGSAGVLSAPHRDLLEAFLAQCDRVKFGGYRPGADESQGAIGAARRFVEDTRAAATPEAAP